MFLQWFTITFRLTLIAFPEHWKSLICHADASLLSECCIATASRHLPTGSLLTNWKSCTQLSFKATRMSYETRSLIQKIIFPLRWTPADLSRKILDENKQKSNSWLIGDRFVSRANNRLLSDILKGTSSWAKPSKGGRILRCACELIGREGSVAVLHCFAKIKTTQQIKFSIRKVANARSDVTLQNTILLSSWYEGPG